VLGFHRTPRDERMRRAVPTTLLITMPRPEAVDRRKYTADGLREDSEDVYGNLGASSLLLMKTSVQIQILNQVVKALLRLIAFRLEIG
jgi:hypothetical protein